MSLTVKFKLMPAQLQPLVDEEPVAAQMENETAEKFKDPDYIPTIEELLYDVQSDSSD